MSDRSREAEKRKAFYKTPEWRKARERRLEHDRYVCQVCGKVSSDHHVDHVVDWVAGGAKYALDNLRTLCKRCHSSKSLSTRHHKRRDAADPFERDEDGWALTPEEAWQRRQAKKAARGRGEPA